MSKRSDKSFGCLVLDLSRIKNQLSVEVPVWTKDDLLLKLQDLYEAVILKEPILAVENKYEVELWNSVFKQPISQHQQSLRQRTTRTVGTNGRPSSEIQHYLALLLERAAGFYLSFMHKLLCRLPERSWPNSVLSQLNQGASGGVKKLASITDRRPRWGAGRLDLDDATLRMQNCRSIAREEKIRFRPVKATKEYDNNQLSVAPTILSRGAQLPEIITLFDPPTVDEDEPSEEKETKEKQSCEKLNLSLSDTLIYLIQHALIHLGDIARYQQNCIIATSYYSWAWLVDPTSGHSYNQLAILESIKPRRQLDSLCYFYVRAMACPHPFPAAVDNLNNMLGVIVNATSNIFDHLFEQHTNGLTSANELVDLLQIPFPLLLRFHALARTAPEKAILAAHELVSAVSALHQIVAPGPTSPPAEALSCHTEWLQRITELANAFNSCRLRDINSINALFRNLQARLTKLVIVHSYGVQTNWGASLTRISSDGLEFGPSHLRRCLLYTTSVLLNWLADIALAVFTCSGEEGTLVEGKADSSFLTPFIVVGLWLKTMSSDGVSTAQYDADFAECAPPLNESVIILLNHLASNWSSLQEIRTADVLQLPELFFLQGYVPLGISGPIRKLPNSTSPEKILSAFLFNVDESDLSSLEDSSNHVALLLSIFRTLASNYPSLLSWSETKGFDIVNRSCPLLPSIPVLTVPLMNVANVEGESVEGLKPVSVNGKVIEDPVPVSVVTNEKEIVTAIEEVNNQEEGEAEEIIVSEEKETAEVLSVDANFSAELEVTVEERVEASVVMKTLPAVCEIEAMTLFEAVPIVASATPTSLANNVDCVHDSSECCDQAAEATSIDVNHQIDVNTRVEVRGEQDDDEEAPKTQSLGSQQQQQYGAGLIVNAELARFIQEQASQVKARQNSMMNNSQNSGSSTNLMGNVLMGNNGSAAALSRSIVRKDLPPRFLRRLQAELNEKEQHNDPINLTPLDQPAPLAMKESEGNFDQPQASHSEPSLPFAPVSTMIPPIPQINAFSMPRPAMMPAPPFGFMPAYAAGGNMFYYPPPPPRNWTAQNSAYLQTSWAQGPPLFSPQKNDQPMPSTPHQMMWHAKRPVFVPTISSTDYPVSTAGGLYGNLNAGDQPSKSVYP